MVTVRLRGAVTIYPLYYVTELPESQEGFFGFFRFA